MAAVRSGLAALAVTFLAVAPHAAAAVTGSAPEAAASSLTGGTWGPAEPLQAGAGTEVPYGMSAISCPSAGNCSAIGGDHVGYNVGGSVGVTETDGRWGTAGQIPAPGPASSGSDLQLTVISCGAAGECGAGGSFDDGMSTAAAIVGQSGGIWGGAQLVAGLSSLATITWSQITAVSCPAAGDCVAVGDYEGPDAVAGAFVVSQADGRWGPAQAVSGLNGLFAGGNQATAGSVSCATAGNCTAVGGVGGGAWAASETDGAWSTATGILATDLVSVSCLAAGDCTAVGSESVEAVEVQETDGVWGAVAELPGTTSLAGGGYPDPVAVSCSSPGNCAATGNIYGPGPVSSVFVASETAGGWGAASLVAGLGDTTTGDALVSALSCGAAGYCSAVGQTRQYQGFVVSETAGTWAAAHAVPGLSGSSSWVQAISCAAAGYCSAGGFQQPTNTSDVAFVADEATASATSLTLSAPRLTYSAENAGQITVAVTSPQTGTPTGSVVVSSAAQQLCAITLTAGSGSCRLAPGRLPGGHYDLTASYSGDSVYIPSRSPQTALTVVRARSATTLTLSRYRVPYRHEARERLTIITRVVSGPGPAGTAVVATGRTTLCVIRLRAGHGSCVLRNRQLRIGSYRIGAKYRGNADTGPSYSAKKTVKITR
jgi:Bacterial Ig-like domain (group 3)